MGQWNANNGLSTQNQPESTRTLPNIRKPSRVTTSDFGDVDAEERIAAHIKILFSLIGSGYSWTVLKHEWLMLFNVNLGLEQYASGVCLLTWVILHFRFLFFSDLIFQREQSIRSFGSQFYAQKNFNQNTWLLFNICTKITWNRSGWLSHLDSSAPSDDSNIHLLY